MILEILNQLLRHRNRAEGVIDFVIPAVELFLDARNEFEAVFVHLIDAGADAFHIRRVFAGPAMPGHAVEVKCIETGVGDALQILVGNRSLPGAVDADRHERFAVNDQSMILVDGHGVGGNRVARPHLNVVCNREKTALCFHIKQREVDPAVPGGQFTEIPGAEALVVGSEQFLITFPVKVERCEHGVILRSLGDRRMHLERGVVGPQRQPRQPGRQHRPEIADLLHAQIVVVESAGGLVADVERNFRLLPFLEHEGAFDCRPLGRDRLRVVQTAVIFAVPGEFDAEPVWFADDVLAAAEHRNLVGFSRFQIRDRHRNKPVFLAGFAFGAEAGRTVVAPLADLITGIGGKNLQIPGREILFVGDTAVVTFRPGAVLIEGAFRGKYRPGKTERGQYRANLIHENT